MTEGTYDECMIHIDPHCNTAADVVTLLDIMRAVHREGWEPTWYVDGIYVCDVTDDDLRMLSRAIDAVTWDGPRPSPEWERPGWRDDE